MTGAVGGTIHTVGGVFGGLAAGNLIKNKQTVHYVAGICRRIDHEVSQRTPAGRIIEANTVAVKSGLKIKNTLLRSWSTCTAVETVQNFDALTVSVWGRGNADSCDRPRYPGIEKILTSKCQHKPIFRYILKENNVCTESSYVIHVGKFVVCNLCIRIIDVFSTIVYIRKIYL